MTVSAVLFDLDGTLLPMDQECFAKTYYKGLLSVLADRGYDPATVLGAVTDGVHAMVKNDGRATNEVVFWDHFVSVFGEQIREEEPVLRRFYETDFQQIRQVCGYDNRAAAVVRRLRERGFRVILATNPLFPAIATESRMRWAGLDPTDFEWYTTYENSRYCKPNSAYYREILQRIGCSAGQCLMVGNDVEEDMIARNLGLSVFLLTDCLINPNGRDISAYPHGSFDELSAYLETL